ncbi:MAG TPA: hypothetical protein VF070_29550 [Streptosporangiaceae bacterium]
MAEAPLLAAEEYFLDVNVAHALVAAFETVTQVWKYPEDESIRCKPVTAPVRGDTGLLATFDLFLPDGRSAEVDMSGDEPSGGGVVWSLREARFFLPCECGRVHHEATIDADGVAHHLRIDCTELAPIKLPGAGAAP